MAREARRRLLLAGVLSLAVVATACGGAGPADAGDALAEPTPSAPSEGDARGTQTAPAADPDAAVPELLDFEADLVGGGRFRGAEVAGAPVALWFWAPW